MASGLQVFDISLLLNYLPCSRSTITLARTVRLRSEPRTERMIKHIVMWDVRGESATERERAALQVKRIFEGMRGRIPGLRHLEVGVDVSRVDYACDVVLYSEFESMDALKQYAHHPVHLQARAELEGVRIARHQVDYTPM